MVIRLERGADLHMAQQTPLSLTVSCFSKIQIGFSFLVPAYLGSPGQRAAKRLCVCVCDRRDTHLLECDLVSRRLRRVVDGDVTVHVVHAGGAVVAVAAEVAVYSMVADVMRQMATQVCQLRADSLAQRADEPARHLPITP